MAYRDVDVAVDRVRVPATAVDAQNAVEDDAELLSNAYDELAVAPTGAAYQRIYNRNEVRTLTSTFERDSTMPGASGTVRFTLKPQIPGAYTLVFRLVPPGRSDAEAGRAVVSFKME